MADLVASEGHALDVISLGVIRWGDVGMGEEPLPPVPEPDPQPSIHPMPPIISGEIW
jgi:hypothetical protein